MSVCVAVCGLIFVMAAFNFINLFLLSLQTRKKEVGIKKTLGATLRNLIRSSSIEVAKVREIGIRKILGATPGDIINLLIVNFMKRISIAFVSPRPSATT